LGGYDVEEIDRENAAEAKRAGDMGLTYRTSPGETQGARATPQAMPGTGTGSGREAGPDDTSEQERSSASLGA
jgi:capsid protein